jgi:hypothetical protein
MIKLEKKAFSVVLQKMPVKSGHGLQMIVIYIFSLSEKRSLQMEFKLVVKDNIE